MAYDKKIEPIIFEFLDDLNYETYQDKDYFYLVNQNDSDFFDFKYDFEKRTLEIHNNVIYDLKDFFKLRYIDADYIIEKWFVKKFGLEVDDNIKPWVTTFRIYRD